MLIGEFNQMSDEIRELLRNAYLRGVFDADNATVDDEAFLSSSIYKDMETIILNLFQSRPAKSEWIPKECECGGRTYECIECGKMCHSDEPHQPPSEDK